MISTEEYHSYPGPKRQWSAVGAILRDGKHFDLPLLFQYPFVGILSESAQKR